MISDQNTGVVDFDVAIIGYGPTGATLANLLGMAGLSTVVLEREAETYHIPRAVHFDDETMRVFQAIGLAEQVDAISIVNVGARFLDAEGALMLDWPRPHAVSAQGWHPSYRFHQPDLENVLREGAARFSNVDIRTKADAFAFEQTDNGVLVHYEDLSKGSLHELTARYVVGCDGARSIVRRFIGSELRDLGFHERWLVVDLILNADKPELGPLTVHRCGSRRACTQMRNPGNRRRWEIRTHDDDDIRTLTSPAWIWDFLGEWLKPEEAEIERAAVYTFHSAVAHAWRANRLFIAGDAAHQTPPFMGQGMCAGVRDAANLGWKLIAVLTRGWSKDLLDTYQSERVPNVTHYIETAVALGTLINGEADQSAFDAQFRDGDGVIHMKSLESLLGGGLSKKGDSLAGTVAPQPVLGDGTRLDEAVGYNFALLVDEARLDIPAAEVSNLFSGTPVVLILSESNPEVARWLSATDQAAVLVRPDRYVLGTARTAGELIGLIRSIDFLPRKTAA